MHRMTDELKRATVSQVMVGSDKDKLMVTGAKIIFYPIIIITACPHGQIVFMGTGNKYTISHGLMRENSNPLFLPGAAREGDSGGIH